MNHRLKGSLVKNIASAFINGLITLCLLLIAPLGLAGVIFNTIAVTISTFLVTMTFDFIALWLRKSHHRQSFDSYLEKEYYSQIVKENQPNFLRENEERE